MTNGTVVVLGRVGRNLGAGMTGGEAFVHDPHHLLPLRLNAQLVTAERLDSEAADRLRVLLERHRDFTGSARAAELLSDWPGAVEEFRLVRPRAEVGRIEAQAEGTEHASDPAAETGDVGVGIP
jgi:glutamate synthase domain-containing protein 3